jgi:hypothetical protein
MRHSKFLILAALLLGSTLGIGLGYWLASGAREPARLPVDTSQDNPGEPTPVRETQDGRRPETHQPQTPACSPKKAGERDASAKSDHPATRALEAIVSADDITGSGVISGSVEDSAGAGVPGCEISLQLETGGSGRYPSREEFKTEEDFLEAMLVFQYRWARRESRARRKVLTDEAGQFKFSDLFGTRARLFANCPKHVHADGNFIAQREVAVGDTVKFVVYGAVPIMVRAESARLREDTPVIVNFTALEGKGLSCWRAIKHGMDVKLHVVPGKYAIQAKADGNGKISPKVEMEIGPEGVGQVLTLSLDAENGIYGKLIFSGAKPRELSVRTAKVEGNFTDEELLREGRNRSSGYVEYDKVKQEFYLNAIDPGEYLFGVFCGDRLKASKRVTLTGGKTEVEIVVPAPEFNPALRVKVEAPKRYSLENLGLNVRNKKDGQFVSIEVWENGPGDYLLGFREREKGSREREAVENAQLLAATHELGIVGADFRPGIDNSLTLTFVEPAEYILDFTGKIPEGRLNFVICKSGETQPVVTESFMIQEGQRAGPQNPKLQPGAYQFEVLSDLNFGFVLANRKVSLVAGSQRIAMDLPAMSTIKIDASGIKQRTFMSLRQVTSGRARRVDFDGNKIAIIGALPPGQYELTRPNVYMDEQRHRVQQEEVLKTFLVPTTETIVLSD